jgi:outer membrane protein assembly factor BamB
VRPAAGVAGQILVWLGVVGVPVALVLPWTWFADPTDQRPDAATMAGLVLLGPVLSLLRLLLGRLDPGYWRISTVVAAAGSGTAAVLAVPAASQVDGFSGVAPGGPIAVLAASAGALGWVLVWIAGPDAPRVLDPRPDRRPGARALALGLTFVLLLATGAVATIQWYAEDRFVDHTTARALPPAGAAAPGGLDRERWRQITAAISVHAAGRYLVVGQPAGVRVLDATTGRERWFYHRSDVRTQAVGLTGNGRTAVAVFEAGGAVLAVGLDVATGHVKWRQRHDITSKRLWRVDRLVTAGDVVVAVPLGGVPGDVIALDSASGDVRWSWRPEREGSHCTIHDVATAGSGGSARATLALAMRCLRDGVVRDTITGLSTVDGEQRWGWEPQYGTGLARGDDPSVAATGVGFLVGYGQFARTTVDGSRVPLRAPRAGVLLDIATGAVRASHEAPGRLTAVLGDTALYLGAETAVAVDVTNGATRWTKPLGALAEGRPLAAAGLDGIGYLLLRGPRTDGAVAGDSGPLRLISVDLRSGDIRLDRTLPLGDPNCATGQDGQPRCDTRPAGLVIGPGVAIVYQQPEHAAPTTDLAALD